MNEMSEYLAHVQSTVAEARRYLPKESLTEVEDLVEHGEPAEGMCSLAWVISTRKVRVPASLVDAIRRYSRELIPPEQMPPDLDAFAENTNGQEQTL